MDQPVDHRRDSRRLRARWRTASLAAGWPFPSDWASAEVDRLCVALACGTDPDPLLGRLGAARAEAGIGLDETLRDLAALHAVWWSDPAARDGLVSAAPDAVPARMVRAVALGWAEVTARQVASREIEDAMTGLTTLAYLRTRLRELYAAAAARDVDPASEHALFVVSLDLSGEECGWSRSMAMVLAADVLRLVFNSGETVSLLAASSAAVLGCRADTLYRRVRSAQRLIVHRLVSGRFLREHDLAHEAVRVREQPLPASHAGACALLDSLL